MVLGAVCSVVLGGVATSSAHAGTVFVSQLTGGQERPDPIDTPATGSATLTLSGGPGKYVLWYSINYKNLSSDPTDGHIHYSIIPPTKKPGEQVGPSVDKLDSFPGDAGRTGKITGDWRWDESHNALTDELVDSLFDGELYFNISSEDHPTGEIRGQIVDPNAATPIPLPPAAWTGIMGLGAAALTAMRFGRVRKTV
jgi:hypothetical protein